MTQHVEDQQENLHDQAKQYGGSNGKAHSNGNNNNVHTNGFHISDDRIWEFIAEKCPPDAYVMRLFSAGEWRKVISETTGEPFGARNSQHEADMAFLRKLFFWTGANREQTYRLFMATPMYRPEKGGMPYLDLAFNKFVRDYEIGDIYYGYTEDANDEGEPAAGANKGPTASKRKFHFEFLTDDAVVAEPLKEYLIEGVLGENDFIILYGDTNTGKTLLVFDMIYSVIQGKPWGPFATLRPLRVIYCTDEGLRGLPGRLRAAIEKHEPTTEQRKLVRIVERVPQLYDKSLPEWAANFIADHKASGNADPDIVFLDNLANAALGANENDNGDANTVVSAVKMIQREMHCAVALLHHTGNNDNFRGASRYRGACDCMMKVASGPLPSNMIPDDAPPLVGFGTLSCDKGRDEEKFKPVRYGIEPVKFDAKHKTARIHWLLNTPTPEAEPTAKKQGKQTKSEQLENALKQHPNEWHTAQFWHAVAFPGNDTTSGFVYTRDRLNKLSESKTSPIQRRGEGEKHGSYEYAYFLAEQE